LFHYGRAAAEADALVKEIRATGGQADAASADLSLPDGVAALATQVRAIAGEQLDVLVSNAGISKAATIRDRKVEDFDRLFATNVRGPFFLIQQLLPILREGLNIIVISSAAARTVVGNPGVDNPSILALRGNQRSNRDGCQVLGSHSRAARHSRERSGTGCDRQ
jgi:NAD(P)-dependent dehydrogenase (short-subunit alcohol dehydrogenase family)